MRLKRQGVGQVRFTLDRQGHVLAVTLVSSAGLPSLDREIQALVKRASPLPTPPADAYVNGTVELTLPIDFSLRGAGFDAVVSCRRLGVVHGNLCLCAAIAFRAKNQ